jgi:hypothetical protein
MIWDSQQIFEVVKAHLKANGMGAPAYVVDTGQLPRD